MHHQNTTCACGCGEAVAPNRRYVTRHNLRNLPRTKEHSRKIAEAQKRAWSTNRQRMPIGSRNYDVHGYVRVKVIEGKGRWELEHKLVMEESIGRKLQPGEEVHHINGIKDDNRLENLYLCTNSVHHRHIEMTFMALLGELLADGVIAFDHDAGRYVRP